VKKIAKNVAQPIFVQNWYTTLSVEKEAPKFGLIMYVIKKPPEVKKCPVCRRKWPNLVTLLVCLASESSSSYKPTRATR
jgi:hypothetical protein